MVRQLWDHALLAAVEGSGDQGASAQLASAAALVERLGAECHPDEARCVCGWRRPLSFCGSCLARRAWCLRICLAAILLCGNFWFRGQHPLRVGRHLCF